MDFILGLPETEEGFDVALSVTDKCSKRVTLLPGKNTYKAEDWATVLLKGLTDWGIPDAIITDRDPKFMSEFWKELATKLKIEMLTSTAYHPQTDGQSEQTNQTAEIALRYFLTSSPKSNWAKYLPRLRSELNKQQNTSTGKSPDEVVYGFKLCDTLSIIGGETESADSDFVKERLVIRKEAEDAANFANLLAKLQYNKHHRPLLMEVGDEVFIKLHKGYTLPSVTNQKLSNQRAGPLKIVKKIGLLAYRLDIPVNWKIHRVISVAQLEPAPKGSDPYKREDQPSDPPAVEEFNSEWHDYEVEKLVGRRYRKLGKGKKITEPNFGPASKIDVINGGVSTWHNKVWKETYRFIGSEGKEKDMVAFLKEGKNWKGKTWTPGNVSVSQKRLIEDYNDIKVSRMSAVANPPKAKEVESEGNSTAGEERPRKQSGEEKGPQNSKLKKSVKSSATSINRNGSSDTEQKRIIQTIIREGMGAMADKLGRVSARLNATIDAMKDMQEGRLVDDIVKFTKDTREEVDDLKNIPNEIFKRVAKETGDKNNAAWMYKAMTTKMPERQYGGLDINDDWETLTKANKEGYRSDPPSGNEDMPDWE
ncbi:reverse partial [Lasallia pustulata]|uniref:Reverse partial n=1 Tax=Lasallia pustulata TaxID=136370 RepID=A0A1W5D2P1_9LECA|nr:reverse partial [Lasallia pustulata]